MVTLCRLEYLTANGWVVGHHGVNLVDPQGYVDRLAANRKFGRATELDARLQPAGRVHVSANLPDPARLRPSDTRVPHLPDPATLCRWCEQHHRPPYEGECLI